MKLSCAIIFAGICISSELSAGQTTVPDKELQELLRLDVEQLPTVSIASKKKESLLDTTAAVYVITQDDIRRSGLNSVPELLRLVPGLQVASLRSNVWAVSSRDVNERFARKLLVMIDGRTVYTPLFSGVYWDVQNLMLDDIDRIEIIRGPGGTLWGANAVNGVINILTKHAKDTQGGLISAGAGNEDKGFADLRYGWTTGDNTYVRAYAKYFRSGQF